MGFFVYRHLGLLGCNIADMKRFLPLVILPLLIWVGCEKQNQPDVMEVDVTSGFMVVDVTSGIHFDHGMDKMISVFGINVYKRWDVELWALVHGASVFAEYLDSDEDGTTDNPEVISEMLSSDFKEGLAIINERGDIGSGDYKDSFWGVSRVEGQDCLSCEGSYQRQTIEEMFHVITQGLEIIYPSVFGSEPGTELRLACEQAHGDCEYSSDCAPDCVHYDCQGPDDCVFIPESCNGAYHYAAPSCEPGGCIEHELFYFAWTSLYGLQIDNCENIIGEWEVCTPEGMMTDPRVALLYELASGQAASAEILGYVLPSAAPNGIYYVLPSAAPNGIYGD